MTFCATTPALHVIEEDRYAVAAGVIHAIDGGARPRARHQHRP
jgi:hypothetical protein